MRKAAHVYSVVAVALLLLALIVFFLPGVGSGVLDSEKVFVAEVHNSLYFVNRAKVQWAEGKHKSAKDVPAMADLAPYLGDWTNRIGRLVTLGINYTITAISEMEPQSDIATLTRDLQFRSGISRYYRAGTRYCLRTRWVYPDSGRSPFRAFYANNRELLAAALFVFGIGTLFIGKKVWNSPQTGRFTHDL